MVLALRRYRLAVPVRGGLRLGRLGRADPLSFAAKLPFGQCPRCRAETLYAGLVGFAEECPRCGLPFARFNVGDGAAAFLTPPLTLIVGGLAVWLQFAFAPPLWVHVLLWVPLAVALAILGLRYAKAKLLAAEWRRNAGEAGRREP